MENSKQVAALNNLIEINNDRIEGYETAAKETNDTDLQRLFATLKVTSFDNLSELRAEVIRLGGNVEEGTRITGKFFRVWMDVKAALTGNNRGIILDSCEFGEDKALEAYETVLENRADLSSEQVMLIQSQQAKLRADHDRVKALRDQANN
ncbi:ferritin-like domain-containing protein [Flavobacterium sp. PLA-1-15]|uniref:ferritin-like domain-containing protein n=1 Tax=Flavobacterium sp. PLA-1-15 TaxID=3380533 RepID=UPI003B7A1506